MFILCVVMGFKDFSFIAPTFQVKRLQIEDTM